VAVNSPQTITVTLKVYESYPTTQAPFGYIDIPIEGTVGITGAIPVCGWALDDIGVRSVEIYRDPVGSEQPGRYGLVYIGEAVFVEGARPDVETKYPGYPLNFRAGWGYMLLTNFLPNQGNGTYTLHAVAIDWEGKTMDLGTKNISIDNERAVKPFGTIDTPTQGGTAFGTAFINFGWALTPLPKFIPIDGSTITVWVDGLPLGHPTYNNFRPDIAALFPGYANAYGAVGHYYLDTTGYLNGVHTIAWSVADSAGAVDGIGSRYFQILNTGSGSATGGARAPVSEAAGGMDAKIFGASDGIKTAISKTGNGKEAEIQNLYTDLASPIHVRRGYTFDRPADPVYPNREGSLSVSIAELERVAIYLDPTQAWETREELEARGLELRGTNIPLRSQSRLDFVASTNDSRVDTVGEKSATGMKNEKNPWITGELSPYMSSVPAITPRYSAFLLVGSELRPLPIGSSFDAERGVLYWQPGPGFLGDFDFVFVDGNRNMKKAVKIQIGTR
jgi:hypothetical protein